MAIEVAATWSVPEPFGVRRQSAAATALSDVSSAHFLSNNYELHSIGSWKEKIGIARGSKQSDTLVSLPSSKEVEASDDTFSQLEKSRGGGGEQRHPFGASRNMVSTNAKSFRIS